MSRVTFAVRWLAPAILSSFVLSGCLTTNQERPTALAADAAHGYEHGGGGEPQKLSPIPSLPQAIALTADAVRLYAASPSAGSAVFPLEAALQVIALASRLVVSVARRREGASS